MRFQRTNLTRGVVLTVLLLSLAGTVAAQTTVPAGTAIVVTLNESVSSKNAKAGQVQFRTDKGGIVQCTIGRASFTPDALQENLVALVDALNKAKPSGQKGVYLKKISISSTMGVGVRVDQATLSTQPH